MINLDYKDARAIHQQIEDGIKQLIISGIMLPDEQLPSVRELAVSLTVNPNTVQRAYKQLENDGFIYSVKGKGNFVSKVTKTQNRALADELYNNLTSLVKELMYLGEDKSDIENVINNIYQQKEDE
jgi:GntR family transcriptional regulator